MTRPMGLLPVAVLGNSDSHSYQDSMMLPGPTVRGGIYRPSTYQWTEIWARLRSSEVDLGPWGTWGSRLKVARVLRALGFAARAPRKNDYEFNFAMSGARCEHLMDAGFPQAPALLRLMDRDPARWTRGVVIVRIGINSVGRPDQLEEYAAQGLTAVARQRIGDCVSTIDRAVRLIRSHHPTTRIVVVSISDDTHLASNLDRWQNPAALSNIAAVLTLFAEQLRAFVERDPQAAFVDDAAWFRRQWHGRTPDGKPAYEPMSFGGPVAVTNTTGDHPRNVTLSDGHAGTISNGLWLINLVELLNARWALGLTPISRDEIAQLADPLGQFGIRPTP